MAVSQHAGEVLRVYPSKTNDDGWWCPQYGDIETPEGWGSLPAGDAFITRQVKRLGPHWIVVRARKGYTQTLGVLAPSENIEKARKLAEDTAARREIARSNSRERREQQEQDYRKRFAEAVLQYLDFAPRYRAMAQRIAEGSSQQATVVGSGRVGRTAKLSLEQKAELAARAYIRHHYTKYEDRLLESGLVELDSFAHRDIREQAHEEVDEFLEKHRPRGRLLR